jgi:uncharacterized membrane protein (UPF0127 family)
VKNLESKGFIRNRYFQIFIFLNLFTFHFFPFAYSASQPNRKITVMLPDGRNIEAVVADTPDLRSSGLMGRTQLKSDEGMLFIFETDDVQMMWMKNMAISIDMIWLNEKKEIITIRPAIPPCRIDPCPVYGPSTSSRYVLEIPAGGSAVFHLREGMKLKFPVMPK